MPLENDLSKLAVGTDSTADPGILPPPPGAAGGFSFAAAPVAAAPAGGFSFNLAPPAPPANDDDDDDDSDEEEDDEDHMKLPAAVLGRVLGLKALEEKRGAVMQDYVKERAALEAKYREKIDPIFADRAKIVAGEAEPELTADDKATIERAGAADDADAPVTGIPDFWLSACGRHEAFQNLLEEGDVEALKYLVDVRCVDFEDLGGFKLEFEFGENPHFTDTVLTKSYAIPNLIDSNGQPEIQSITGTEIHWKTTTNLCRKEVKKKQKSKRGKNAGQTRVVTKVEDQPSFFHFFASVPLPNCGEGAEDEEDEMDEALRDKIDGDVELAFALRNAIVPHAVLWFTGEACDSDDDDDEEYEISDEDD